MKQWRTLIKGFWGAVLLVFVLSTEATASELSDLYDNLVGSVVTIHTFEDQQEEGGLVMANLPSGLGSGVVIDDTGLIVTASHVVHNATGLFVEFDNGQQQIATMVSSVVPADLALIKVDYLPNGIKPAKLGDSTKTRIGEKVFVIGAPLGISKTLTVGYVSGKHDANSSQSTGFTSLIQTDAAINPGNSGGPMFNMKGEVIGIASYIQTRSGGSDGLGFVVSSKSIREWLLDKAPFWSGIDFVPVNETLKTALGLPFSGGVLLQRVNRLSGAYDIGLRGGTVEATVAGEEILLGGDIITSINGVALNNANSAIKIVEMIRNPLETDVIQIHIWRSGKMKAVLIPLQNK